MKHYALPINAPVDTDWCKSVLAIHCPASKPSQWKRVSKAEYGQNVLRKFENKAYNLQASVLSTPNGVHVTSHPLTDNLTTALVTRGNTIKHCGDYCHMYYNAELREVWMVMGDGDCEEPFTTMDDIKTLLMIPGINKVHVEAEYDPPLNKGWMRLYDCNGITLPLPD